MPEEVAAVEWQVATDEHMHNVVRRGTARAVPRLGHSVHVEPTGLEPAHEYWYQFRYRGHTSAVGRTRTLPRTGAPVARMTFAFASCQHWASGYYAAYRDMAQQDLDLVVHLGDYVYEDGIPSDGGERRGPVPAQLRDRCESLGRWRLQYARYKTDPDLQRAHAAAPWIVTWDDHEVVNNYAATAAPHRSSIRRLRAAAYQAYYEHQPLRRGTRRGEDRMRLYRRVAFGDLVQLDVVDGRQHRSKPACGWSDADACPEQYARSASMLGAEQERWLVGGLEASPAQWNVMASNVMMARLDFDGESGTRVRHDFWDGYPAARNRLTAVWADRRVRNPVVITGDCHAAYVNDIKRDFDRPDSPVVATEFVGTSITSPSKPEVTEPLLPHNPHIKFHEPHHRGYTRCTVDAEQWQTDLRVVADVHRAGAPAATAARFVVENGHPSAQRD